ncbi:MAG: ATP-binding cassette, subfamily bacterial MsbA [Candidatus Sumerlaeota bacterium]|nr:ATP-binding cassette, subfamily bacterial MsbA [Candidatus Sumerlaeota bacterium]
MAPYEPPKKLKEKRSVIKNRGLVIRVLSLAWPWRGLVVSSIVISFLVAALGVASIAPVIPIVNVILTPQQEEVNLDDTRERQAESEDEFRQQKEIVRDPGKAAQIASIGDDLQERFPIIGVVETYAKKKKEELKGDLTEYLLTEREDAIKIIVAFLIILVIIKAFLEYTSKYLMMKVMYQTIQRLKVDLYRSSLNLDFTALQTRTSGNLISRLSADVEKVRTILKASLTQSVQTPFEMFFLLAFLFYLSPKVTLITMVAMPLVVAPISILGRHLRKLSKRDAEEDAYLVDVMQETIQGMQIVKAFGSEKREAKRFKDVSRAQLHRQLRRQRIALAAPHVTDVLTMTAMGAVLIAGGYVVLDSQEMNAGEFTAYLVALTRFYKPIKSLSSAWVRLQRGLASAERVFEIIDAKPVVQEKPDAIVLPRLEREIVFENVVFAYDNKRETVLNGFSMTIPKGKCFALVGPSGGGKSTVTKLIPRFYDPHEGRILVDGIDIRDVTFASLRSQIAIVTQETILFDTTIFENIAYGRKGATREEIENASRAANAHNFIMELPEGYNTRLGERGSQLSGGQRQRIAIARALLRDCPILILDEATSALDNESEALVQDALDRLMEGRTTLVIAHRLSTIQNADQIVVLADGAVVEQGTHSELLARQGRYADFWNMAQKREEEDSIPETPEPVNLLGEPAPG